MQAHKLTGNLKGQCYDIFKLDFHQTIKLLPLIQGLSLSRFSFKFAKIYSIFEKTKSKITSQCPFKNKIKIIVLTYLNLYVIFN
jgi:hypothetical protein